MRNDEITKRRIERDFPTKSRSSFGSAASRGRLISRNGNRMQRSDFSQRRGRAGGLRSGERRRKHHGRAGCAH